MKITDIITLPVNLGDGNHLFVKVLTDADVHGIGEAYRVGPDEATERTIHDFKRWLIGQDPRQIEHLWRIMYNGARFPGGSVVNAAISAIEIACWDVKARALGVGVYELLGGRCRDKIRVYRIVSDTDDAKRATQEQGFGAIKMYPMPPAAETMAWNRTLRGAAEKMQAVRQAVGDDIDIGLDPHAQIFEPVRALQLAEAVRPFNPFFFEEPLRPENIAAMGELHQKINVPLATGEMLYTKYQFRDLLAASAADIIQPDLLICGGLLEAKKIAAMAEAHYVTVAPHSPLGPVSTAIAAHFAAATPNFIILEYRTDHDGPMRDLVNQPLHYDAGYIKLPDAPGFGIELNEKAFAGRPLQPWRRPLICAPDGNILYQ